MSADRVVLHLDMDAFYASVEQRERPELRGRPVVVGADPQQGEGRGVVAAASYEARKYGIHSAQPIAEAWRNCPGAEFVRPRFDLYRQVSRELMGLVDDAVDVLEPISVDEAYADVADRVDGRHEAAGRLADALRRRVRDELDLTCSVGVGPNKLIAKVASDEDKPDGTTVVEPGAARSFLAPRDVQVLPGVGPETADVLAGGGLDNVRDLANAEPARLEDLLGTWGPRLVERARGVDPRPVDPTHETKSVGAECTFGEDLPPDEARPRLDRIARTATRRLDDEDAQARTVTLKLRLTPFDTYTRQRTLPAPTDDPDVVLRVARQLFDQADPDRRVRLLGVRLADLRAGPRQARLDRWPSAGEPPGDPVWKRDGYVRFA